MKNIDEQNKKIDKIVNVYATISGNGKLAKAQRKKEIEGILGIKLPSSPTDNTLVAKALLKFNKLKELNIDPSLDDGIKINPNPLQENSSNLSKQDFEEIIKEFIRMQKRNLDEFESYLRKTLFFKD